MIDGELGGLTGKVINESPFSHSLFISWVKMCVCLGCNMRWNVEQFILLCGVWFYFQPVDSGGGASVGVSDVVGSL